MKILTGDILKISEGKGGGDKSHIDIISAPTMQLCL